GSRGRLRGARAGPQRAQTAPAQFQRARRRGGGPRRPGRGHLPHPEDQRRPDDASDQYRAALRRPGAAVYGALSAQQPQSDILGRPVPRNHRADGRLSARQPHLGYSGYTQWTGRRGAECEERRALGEWGLTTSHEEQGFFELVRWSPR